MKNKKLAVLKSVISLLLCVSMLAGTTFAWFTDGVRSGRNTIVAGNLDVELAYMTANGEWLPVTADTNVFEENTLWEPGHTEVVYLRVSNAGTLALKYQLGVNIAAESGSVNVAGEEFVLSDYIEFAAIEDVQTAFASRDAARAAVQSAQILSTGYTQEGELLAGDPADYVAFVVYMPETVGNAANYRTGELPPRIELGISLFATQTPYETDSFGADYDWAAGFPEVDLPAGGKADVTVENGATAADVTISGGNVSAEVPAGVQVEDGTTELSLSVTEMSASGSNVTLATNEVLKPVDVHVSGVSASNTTPMKVRLDGFAAIGLNEGNLKLYHVENGETVAMTRVSSEADFSAHNQFTYDPATGNIVLYLATFSEITAVANTENAWKGEFDYSWYTNAVATADAETASNSPYIIANADQLAAFGAIVGGMNGQNQDSFSGKTVKLIADINLGDAESKNNPNLIFYPIGYYNSEGTYERTNTAITSGLRNFEGTFDGNGHIVENFYHNTWEMKGDHDWYSPEEQYYRDGMGLFGRVYKGTVKNLTVKNFSSDGEIATTGVIAAYADFGATFENISIFDCNPRVYNIGNGGIVGCVGWYTKGETDKKVTFKNITVDNSNKISALWGSYDVACGGIVGQYYPTSGQTSAGSPKNAGVHFENCHISAQMDVYNDVCANYQYYAYRYAGMLIGSVRENVTIDGHSYPKMDGITAEDCTVHFGTWNDYYYCEFEKNGHPSYSGPDDYKFSRIPHSEINFTDSNGNGIIDTDGERDSVTGCKHEHTAAEDNQCVYLEFNNLVTGYGWGVTSKGLKDFEGVTNMDITQGDHEKSVEKFEGKVTELANNKGYKLDDIFTFVDKGVELVPGALTVTVTNLDEKNPVSAEFVRDDENWENGTLTLTGTGKVQITIQDYYFCTPTTITVDVTERAEEEKFDIVMNNGDFLHRVGNQGTVPLDKLFKAKDGVTVGNVSVTVETVGGNAAGTYTSDANWTNGTIQFSNTGVVKVTITDNDYCIPTELRLEVVDAVNVTSATSATANNVVLLNDCGFGSLEVSGGYTLYGNGFTMTCASDSAALDMGYSFVTLNNGILDNVQIICPNFDYAVLYKDNLSGMPSDRKQTTDKTRYFNVKSGVMVSGNSQILNSRISGARAAVNVSGGNCIIDNSRIELGAVASILVGAANTLTLRDVTMVQKPTVSTYDSTKTLLGFSVLVLCDGSGNSTQITLEGKLVQNAWASSDDSKYVPSSGQTVVTQALSKTEFVHEINGKDCLNLGIAYMPEELGKSVNEPTINDNRPENEPLYGLTSLNSLGTTYYVYSYKNTNGTADDFKTESEYEPNEYGDNVAVTYSDTADGLTTDKSFGTDGWVYELNVDLDKLSGYTLDFSKLSMTVNGVPVTDFKVNGSTKPTSPVAVTAGGVNYTLTATIDGKEYTATYKVTGTETSKESPSLVASNYEAGLCVASSKGGTWHGAAPALEGIQIKYWSVAEKQYKTINLSDYTPTTKGQLNGTNTTWTYSPENGDFTLTLTGGQVHSNNNVYAMPVVCNGKLYFVAASSKGLVNSGNSARTIPVSYTFKDNNNGDVLTFSHTWSVAEDQNNEYKYSDFCNGTLTKLEGGNISPCVTPDTLVSLADGTQKRIDQVTYTDNLLVWDFYKGDYAVVPAAIIFDHGADNNTVIRLTFSDGTVVKVVNLHQFFDATLSRFVSIDAETVEQFVGHNFAKQGGTVRLVDYEVTQEYVEAWGVISAMHYNIIVEGMISTDFMVEDYGLFNYFEVGADMKYDSTKMAADIAKYGLYTYEDFADHLTCEQFAAFNVPYFKIAVGKGQYTYESILNLIDTYLSK